MKNFLRVLSITLLVSNSFIPMQLFGRGHGKKKETKTSQSNQSVSVDKGKVRARSDSNISNENFAAKIEAERPSVELEENEPSSSNLRNKSEYELANEDNQARLDFAKEKKVLADSLVKALIEKSPAKLKSLISNFELMEIAGDGLKKGIILIGEPGVGKSDLSRAMAQHLGFDIEFLRASYLGDEFRKSSEKDLRKIFEPLFHRKSPVFVVFDELQTLTAGFKDTGRSSEANIGTAFWQLIDKLFDEKNIFIIGTINKEEDLPPQLSRRVEKITIPSPDANARQDILKHHLYNLECSIVSSKGGTVIESSCSSILSEIAKKADKFTGSDLVDLVKKSVRSASDRFKLKNPDRKTGYIVVKKEDLQKAFEEQSLEVYKRTYPQGRFPSLTWENAGRGLDRTISLINLMLSIQQSLRQDTTFKYQRMVTMLSHFRNIWPSHKDSSAIEVLERFENTEISKAQRISDPSLDLQNTHYNLDGLCNQLNNIPYVGNAAASGSHIVGARVGAAFGQIYVDPKGHLNSFKGVVNMVNSAPPLVRYALITSASLTSPIPTAFVMTALAYGKINGTVWQVEVPDSSKVNQPLKLSK